MIVIAVVIGAILVASNIVTFNFDKNIPDGTDLIAYAGRTTLNLLNTERYDGSVFSFASASIFRVIHGASKDYGNILGTVSGLETVSCTGVMTAADGGILYVVVDYGTNTTSSATAGQGCPLIDYSASIKGYVQSITGWDGDDDGFDEELITLNLNSVDKPTGYETRNIDVPLVWNTYDSTLALTALTQATGLSNSAFSYGTSTGYASSFEEGDMAKIAKIQVTLNSTSYLYADNSTLFLTHVKIGQYTFTGAQFGTFDTSTYRWEITFGDQSNLQGGKEIFYAKNAGTLWCPWELKTYSNVGHASYTIIVTLSVYYYTPASGISSAVTSACTINTSA